MPFITLPIPETVESVTRPIMLDVVRQLMGLTGISKRTNIVYYGDMERSKQLNSAIAREEPDDPNTFAHNERISIDVSETYFGEMSPNTLVWQPESLLIFEDAPLSIVMKPVYEQMEAVISIRYRAVDKNSAVKWRDYVKARIGQRRELYLHNITYSFGIPEVQLEILKELHRLRENVDGYGEDYDTYFAKHRTPKMTLLTNMNGSAKLWAVPETQTEVQGWFDWEYPEESTRDGDGGTYTVAFNYRFRYARPADITMIYPIMIHNQLLGQRYRDLKVEDQNDLLKTYAMNSRILNSLAGAQRTKYQQHYFGVAIPVYDEFFPRMVPPNTRRLVTVLFSLDPDNPHAFLNLRELGSRQIHPEILAYLSAECDYVTYPGQSVLNLALYKNEFLIRPNPPAISVDADLNVTGLLSANLRLQHHLRLSLVTDWHSLSRSVIQRLLTHGRAAVLMLDTLDPTLAERGYMPIVMDDNTIALAALMRAIANLKPVQTATTYGPSGMMYTVQELVQEATLQ